MEPTSLLIAKTMCFSLPLSSQSQREVTNFLHLWFFSPKNKTKTSSISESACASIMLWLHKADFWKVDNLDDKVWHKGCLRCLKTQFLEGKPKVHMCHFLSSMRDIKKFKGKNCAAHSAEAAQTCKANLLEMDVGCCFTHLCTLPSRKADMVTAVHTVWCGENCWLCSQHEEFPHKFFEKFGAECKVTTSCCAATTAQTCESKRQWEADRNMLSKQSNLTSLNFFILVNSASWLCMLCMDAKSFHHTTLVRVASTVCFHEWFCIGGLRSTHSPFCLPFCLIWILLICWWLKNSKSKVTKSSKPSKHIGLISNLAQCSSENNYTMCPLGVSVTSSAWTACGEITGWCSLFTPPLADHWKSADGGGGWWQKHFWPFYDSFWENLCASSLQTNHRCG